MSNLIPALVATMLCLAVAGCGSVPREPETLHEARLKAALELKQACVRHNTESGWIQGTGSLISTTCWQWARDRTGLR